MNQFSIVVFQFIIFLLFITLATAQSLRSKRADHFIEAMIKNDNSLESYVLPEELAISKRLGITYEGVKNKFLISYEIPDEIINKIKSGEINYKINIEKLDEHFSILHFEVPEKNYETHYYFKNGWLISPPYFYYKNWKKMESDNFIFYISDPDYFNEASIKELENFLWHVSIPLDFDHKLESQLKKNKIIYILCKDEDEIEKLTGYKARGMYNLAYDYIITTYNCHYHELVHLLVNFRLKTLPLYTHPFLQEGLAVALGGRGGKEPEVILNLGKYIAESGFMEYSELLISEEFKNIDASISYPLAGLYNQFLLNKLLSFNNYAQLYRKFSGVKIDDLSIERDELPDDVEWLEFLTERDRNIPVRVDINEVKYRTLKTEPGFTLEERNNYYLFKTKGDLLISVPGTKETFISKLFKEQFLHKIYDKEKYLIKISENEISIYNLYTNNLIANYVSGFTLDMKPVPKENGFYKFQIRKDLIEENPDSWEVEIVDN